MKKTLKWSLVMMLAVFGLTFASCSDDDETPTVPTVEEVVGEYSGKMTYDMAKAAASEEAPGTTLDLTVKNDSITFEKFPYEALVEAIVGKDGVPGIIEIVKELRYQVSYTATMNAANDSVQITLKPKTLEINLGAMGSVMVTITAENKGSYVIEKKNMKFTLVATEAKLGETNFLKTPITLSFDMNKKK